MHAEFVRLFCRCVRSNNSDDVRRKATAWSIFSVELLQMVANAAADDDDDDGKSNNRRAVTKHLHSCGVIVLSHLRLYLLMPPSPPVILIILAPGYWFVFKPVEGYRSPPSISK